MGHHHSDTYPKHDNHLALTDGDYKHHKADIWKTTGILSFVTVFEVGFAIWYEKSLIPGGAPLWALQLTLVVLSLLKAGYIMAVFMHVKHETRAFILTILVPFSLLIWMIISFIYDGNDWNGRNNNRFGDKPHPSVLKQHGGVVIEHGHH
ncbi:MAG: cytochrome C oxidase subunit IV family protein [Chitinophagales bacterium]|nr:cytochrome C oxidase subunit IV family protein [Chitinophagales bacterium]